MSAPSNPPAAAPARLSIRQAAFIGVGAMVGAGIFSLLGAAGEVAGAAVWLSFPIAGGSRCCRATRSRSSAPATPRPEACSSTSPRLGRRPLHRHHRLADPRDQRDRHRHGRRVVRQLRASAVTDGNTAWAKFFAVAIVVLMTLLNIVGTQAVARAQTVVVVVVISILTVFAVVTLANMDPHLLAFSGYPSLKDIISSVALTFFAFLGFGVVTFTAKDLAEPNRQLPRAMFLALGIATVIYIAVALGVFGTLTVSEVIASGGTAIAVAAQPVLGRAGYWLMSITALFATAGATNAGLYPAPGLCDEMATTGQFPPALGRRFGGRAPAGLLLTAAHRHSPRASASTSARSRRSAAPSPSSCSRSSPPDTSASATRPAHRPSLLIAAVATATIVLVAFALTTLVTEPGTAVAIVVIAALSVALDLGWKHRRDRPTAAPTIAPAG